MTNAHLKTVSTMIHDYILLDEMSVTFFPKNTAPSLCK